jgi:flagellar biosynthesis chaperone FliJ
MNKARRKQIEEARDLLGEANSKMDEAKSILESVKDEEQDAFDNMPESLQEGDRGQQMQVAIEALERCIDNIEGLDFDDIWSGLDEATE